MHLTEGFDYLGFNVRRYRHGKLLIKPSDDAVRRLRKRLANEMRSLRGSNAMAVIARLNPMIRGWAAYYRGVVSSRIFSSLDDYVWRLTYKWATHTHPNKPKKWIARRYFGKFNKFRNDRWVFGDRGATSDRGQTPYLVKFSWTNIVRHQMVIGGASPDDPDLTDYWVPGADESHHRWTPSTCACSPSRTVAVRSAVTSSSSPTSHPNPRWHGNGGG